jgi:polyhydroxybutyrate depolymerase
MRAQRDNIDDVKFIRSMVDQLAQEHKIDRRRVFATGLSNGGLMSHRLAAEASDMITGIAPVAGGMAPAIAESFNPRFPVSILIIQGDADPIVPIDGGDVMGRDSTRGKVIATRDALAKYVRRNGNVGDPVHTQLGPASGKSIDAARYADGPGGVKTWYYLVKNGGHEWPPRSASASPDGDTRGLSALELVWEFFKNCPERQVKATPQ